MNQNVLEAKKSQVTEISEVVNNSKCFIVAEYRGLTVAEISLFRKDLAKANAKCTIFKNSLVHRATENVEGFSSILEGPNAFIYSEDPIAGPKEAAKFAKKHPNFVIKGGIVEGKSVSAEQIKVLAKLPGREGLLSMLCSVLQAPVRNFACAVKAIAEKE